VHPKPKNRRKKIAQAFLAATLLVSFSAQAVECDENESVVYAKKKMQEWEEKKAVAVAEGNANNKSDAERMIAESERNLRDANRACESETRKSSKLRVSQIQCEEKQARYAAQNPKHKKKVFDWKGDQCIELYEAKAITDSDECNSANVFTDLKGKNCKNALETVNSVKARNEAVTQASTAATTAYSSLQASQATGEQGDAQAKQQQIYQVAGFSKLATAALNLQGAMQLKSAASGAEEASSTITSAQQSLAQACANEPDDQICFYQNAEKFGISKDALNYANFERMKRGAAQSHDQAEAANALAKQSLITGMADALVGMQALQMARQAAQNAQNMAPPPTVIPPPPGTVRFGQSGAQGDPNLVPNSPSAPVDYGNPADGSTFGELNNGRIEGGLAPGKMGTPNIFKAASSGVSGGGGASASGGGRGGGKGGSKAGRSGPRNTAIGEIKHGGGVGFKGGSGGGAGDGAANPFADALSKLFPQNLNGNPVVDARQIASGGGIMEEEALEGTEVTTSDLTLFEQITAKYRQLDGSGRF